MSAPDRSSPYLLVVLRQTATAGRPRGVEKTSDMQPPNMRTGFSEQCSAVVYHHMTDRQRVKNLKGLDLRLITLRGRTSPSDTVQSLVSQDGSISCCALWYSRTLTAA